MGKLNQTAWKDIGALDHVLKWVQQGVPLPFGDEKPKQKILPNRVKWGKESCFETSELKRLEKLGYNKECEGWTPVCTPNFGGTQEEWKDEVGFRLQIYQWFYGNTSV